MKTFLQWTAWTMNPLKPYGMFHVLFTLLGFGACWLLAGKLKNINEKQNNILLISAGMFLSVTEIYKQLFYYYVIGNESYQWWIFPFQLCSIPMYLCLMIPLIKNKRVKNHLYEFLLSFNLLGGFISFFEPSGLIHEYWTLTIHAFAWHLCLVLLGFYIGRSRRAAVRLSDYKGAVMIFLFLCLTAFMINLLFYEASEGTINMFYVGPAISPIIVFKDIAAAYGWYVNTPVYMLAVSMGAFVFHLFFYLINRKQPL